MPRVMCIWFPRWPIQRLRGERPELRRSEIVLFSDEGRRPVVTACTPRAESRGVRIGLPLAEARSLRPVAVFLPADEAADIDALRRLAIDGQRFSPLVGIEDGPRPESLLGIVDGCTHLLGGEGPFLERVRDDWVDRGYRTRLAIAGSPAAAWAVARARKIAVVPPGEEASVLSPLPVVLLRLPGETLERLQELGLNTIGDVLRLPREALASRFGVLLPRRIDQALGLREESITCERLRERIEAVREWEAPIEDRQDLLAACGPMLRDLLSEADRRGVGVLELEGHLQTEAGPVAIEIRLSGPTRDEAHLAQLVALHLERRTWPGGVVAARWAVVRAGRIEQAQGHWLEDDPDRPSSRTFGTLVDRLASRLEPKAVLRFVLLPDAQPEHAVRLVPWTDAEPTEADTFRPPVEQSRGRPLRMLGIPQPIDVAPVASQGPPVHMVWQGRNRRVVRAWGPERIATGWWRSQDVQRDYYRAEWEEGTQVWVYREPRSGRWFLHGFFD